MQKQIYCGFILRPTSHIFFMFKNSKVISISTTQRAVEFISFIKIIKFFSFTFHFTQFTEKKKFFIHFKFANFFLNSVRIFLKCCAKIFQNKIKYSTQKVVTKKSKHKEQFFFTNSRFFFQDLFYDLLFFFFFHFNKNILFYYFFIIKKNINNK